MRRLIIHYTVAFVTFTVGVIIAVVFSSSSTPVSQQPTAQVEFFHIETKPPVYVDPKPQESPPAKPNTNSDLSIAIDSGASGPNSLPTKALYIKLVKHGPTVIDLDLAESIDNQEVKLNFKDNNEYRLLQRYRTSMSVSAEGPHLDLVDWRHFDSQWTQLKAVGSKRFRTLATNQMHDSKFPPTTTEEIVQEVRRRVGTTWPEVIDLAKDCDGPNDGACLVLISSIYLRIQKRVGVRWMDAGVVEIRIPMGC